MQLHRGVDVGFIGLDATSPMTWHGGPVMSSDTVHAIFWQPASLLPFPAGYQSTIDQFLADVAADSGKLTNVYATTPQYTGDGLAPNPPTNTANYSSRFSEATLVTDPLPASDCTDPVGSGAPCILQSDLKNEISTVRTHNPSFLATQQDLYILYLPPGLVTCTNFDHSECSSNVFCGYHTDFPGHATPLYVIVPYPDAPPPARPGTCDTGSFPSGNRTADNAINTTSHEQNEAVTDPHENAWYDDVDGIAGENGDKCAYNFGTFVGTGTARYNQVIAGRHYWLQQEWSNDGIGAPPRCLESAFSPINAAIIGPAAAPEIGQTVAFDGRNSTNPGGAVGGYSWVFGDGGSGSGAVVGHAYAAAGTYTATLTVTDGATPSHTAASSILVKVNAAPIAAFTGPPTRFRSLTAAVFDASASTAGSAITSFAWSFGDGQTSRVTAPTTTHAYLHPGVYQVTLTVLDAAGLSSQVAQPVTVVNRPPMATARAFPRPLRVGRAVHLSSGGSQDLDGHVVASRWRFDDGGHARGAVVSHVFHRAGRHTARLTVTDNRHATASVTLHLTVKKARR